MRRRVLSLFLGILFISLHSLFANADDYTKTRNHVIIALDESGTDNWLPGTRVMEGLKQFLFNADNPLLGDDDFFSIVGIKADCSAARWGDFVYVKRNPAGQAMSYINDKEFLSSALNSQYRWNTLAASQRNYSSSYSLVSIAKPYILKKLGEDSAKQWVERTFILLVTDHRYNGGDFYNELQYFLGSQSYINRNIGLFDVLDVCYDVEKEFCIKYLDVCEWRPYNGGIYHNVELFEVCPNQEYLTLPAVIEYSPSVTATRRKGRRYHVALDFKHSNPHFEVDEMKVYLCSKDGSSECVAEIHDMEEYQLDKIYRKRQKVNNIRIEATLRLKDGTYNSVLLSPDMYPGLTQIVEIRNEKDAKILFGLARLPDWLWIRGIKNQQVAAIVISFIILFLVIAAIVIYILKTRTYVPRKDEISIKFYD